MTRYNFGIDIDRDEDDEESRFRRTEQPYGFNFRNSLTGGVLESLDPLGPRSTPADDDGVDLPGGELF